MEEHAQQYPLPSERGRAWVPWLVTALVVLLGGVTLWLSHRSSKDAQARAETAEAEARVAHDRAQAADKAREELTQKLASLESEHTKLSAEKDQLTKTVEEQEAELAKLKATYEDLEDKMKKEIANGEIRVSQAGGRIQVDLVDKILFDSGDASISKRGGEVLTRLGAVLAKVEDKVIQVSGHTDDSPPSEKLKATFPTNWELSVARAVTVVRALQESGGVPARRLVAAGYGEMSPVATNATPQGRARNRRIEILLMPDLSKKPAPAALKKAAAQAPATHAVLKPVKGTTPAKKR
ncbi:chemotaxis protein MotB [Corallococcus sp. H22C18031201]|nr:chemotaxis protein MotB [Corallococcus sp. H22C18031201]